MNAPMRHIPVILLLLSLALLLPSTGCDTGPDNNPVNSLEGVQLFDIRIPPDRYAELLANRWSNEEVPADIVVDGKRYRGTLEPQGAGSRYHVRWSFKLTLREGELINGLRESNLSVQTFDSSRLRTALALHAFGAMGFATFDYHPIFLRINDKDVGLYLQIERIDVDYFRRRGMPVHELIKTSFGARFTFEGGNHLARYFEKEIPKSDNLNDLGDFIHALDLADPDRIHEQLSSRLDVDGYLRYHALASILNHIDGFGNNLYFYRATPQSPYVIIPWDFDKLLASDHAVGLVGGNELAGKLLQSDSCVAVYKREAYRALDNALDENVLFPKLDGLAARMAAAFRLDPWLGGAGISFALESDAVKMHLMNRKQFFRDNLDTLRSYPR